MTESITPELFHHLVQLAALELNPEEAEYLRKELNNQLKAIQDLEAIPLDKDTPVTSHGVPYTAEITPPLRKDTWNPDPAVKEIMSQTPQSDAGYIVVPDIPHIDL
jgi:aspartyl-tRNA(Asn)/glutamyl-tRNA(Gln) amidotransferase subunit C